MRLILALISVVSAIPTFEEWTTQWGKDYANDMVEHAFRKSVYEKNLADIERVNNDPESTWTAGVNEYSDMTWEEFKAMFLTGVDPQHCSATGRNGKSLPPSTLPDAVDWREKGVVTGVKNQGSCGSCWTFSTTGAMESAWAIAGNPLTELAEQQLVDCAGGFDNHGCNGGLPSQAFQYLMWAGGQEKSSDYHYTAKDGTCKFSASKVAATIKDEFNITVGDETDTGLPGAIANHGPVSICYQVASDFRNYHSGVYNSKICKNGPMDVNHAVLAVGYGTESGTPFYWVKNSWGTSFGIKGYFKIIRGKNMCGIATCSSYPIM